MSKLSFLFKKLLSSGLQSQIEAGYLNSEGKLTESGQLTLLQGFYEGATNGSDYLTARAEDLIARRKEEKDNNSD